MVVNQYHSRGNRKQAIKLNNQRSPRGLATGKTRQYLKKFQLAAF
ncbi:hypothetical protein [Nostoc sp.]